MQLEEKLDGFCRPVSLFWDGTAAHANTSAPASPDFTLCFEDTVILGGICFVFWLAAAVKLLVVRGKTRISKSLFNWLLTSKLVLLLLPLLTAVCDFFFHVGQAQRANYQYLSPLVLACTMAVAAVVLVHERQTRTRSSAILFLFWLGMVIYSSIRARTLALREKEQGLEEHPLLLTTFSLQYAVYVVQLMLSMVPERLVMPLLLRGERKPCPENYVTFLSRISFWWLNSLLWRGWKRPLEDSDLTDLNPQDKSATLSPAFQKNWDHEMRKTEGEAELRAYHPVWSRLASVLWCGKRKKKTPSLVLALVKTYWRILLSAGLLKLMHDLLNFVSPQILRLIIGFVSDPEEAAWKGYMYAALLFVVAMVQAAFLQQYFHRGYIVGMRMRTVLMAAVYKKALRLSSKARKESTVGEIVNLMSVDANRVMRLMSYVQNLWSGPFQIVLAIIFLWVTIGPSVLAGLATAIVIMPVNIVLAAWRRKYQVKQLAEKDNRIKVVNEVLSGIKVIKLYAWEVPYEEKITGIRGAELGYLKKDAVLRTAFSLTWISAPMLITLVTLGTYVLVHLDDPNERLTPEKAFVTLALLNILNFPLTVLPMVIGSAIEASVSLKRLGKFLRGEELDPDTVEWSSKPAADTEDVVSMVGAQFAWDSAEQPVLSDLNLHVKPGQLVAVVGQVGAGKSSLISAMLGEMEKLTGRVAVQGSVAYVPQQPWILNATLKDNILFGKEEDEELYHATLHSCALEPDLEVLPRGDLAEIGEKGINLSGGQKQRVSLARAAYQEAEVYLLDDPLSAVDSHVGRHIFDKVIGPEGMLRDKVRILNTHAVTFLPQCDHIVVMESGRISEQGSYPELMERSGSFGEFLRTYSSTEQDKDKEKEEEDDVEEGEEEKKKGSVASTKKGSLITEEKAETGRVHFSVFLAYCKACTYVLSLLTILLNLGANGFIVGSYFWLAEFSNAESAAVGNDSADSNVGYYLGIYTLLGVIQSAFLVLGSLTLAVGSILGARTMHNAMLRNILRSPMSFFDTTPLGRILNRFSLDVDTIDELLPQTVDSFIHCLFNVLNVLIIIAIITPIFLVAAIPLGILYWFIQRFYVATSRQLKRLESTTRSPIYSQFQETLNGVSSIRAYRQQERFTKDSERKVDSNVITYYPNICINRWLAMRLEFVGNLVVFLAAFFAAVQRNHQGDLHLRINAGLVGLSISYALQLTNTLNWMVRMSSDLETNIIAVERVKEYSETPTEATAVVESHRPSSGWPPEGRVTFHHYSAKYREELDLALSDISLDVAPGTKVGIVGRTGAGKSSLSLGLFRIMEAAGGSITVDGVDVASIGLQDLRSRITIIPQDPVLFSGSIRMNLDPFNNYTDAEVWKALESAHLSSFVSGLPEALGHLVTEGGENLSVGQRQLVCLARALLRKTKILVLDEATAAVDLETDDLIQKTIRTEFADCTILTIAHRINTIMDYDCVVVLDKGRMVEYDTIPALLQQPQGYFSSLAREAGVVNS